MNYLLAVLVIFSVVVPQTVFSSPSDERPISAVCVLHNPYYVGDCLVEEPIAAEATAREACSEVLECMNNVRCIKVYCNATTIRQFWTLKRVLGVYPVK